jgi:3-deoxy-D-manno-octulosonate 8-phosphate phosphatase (KDO 8-P phosphatase)
MNKEIKKILSNIKLIALDFDGVLTDNRALITENGTEAVYVNRSDGLAVNLLKKDGYRIVIVSTEENMVVKTRANKLNIDCLYGIKDKKEQLVKYCDDNNINMENVIFVGNDLNDVGVMKAVGISICPKDAYCEVKTISNIVLKTNGGDGVIRELFDLINKYNKRK